jgi:polyferredoxin
MAVWSAVGIGLLVALLSRDRLEVNVLHDRNPQFVLESNGDIRNGYSIKILNMIAEPRVIRLSLDGLEGASMRIIGIDEAPGVSRSRYRSSRTNCGNSRSMCTNPRSSLTSTSASFNIIVEETASSERDVYVANFHAPEMNQ